MAIQMSDLVKQYSGGAIGSSSVDKPVPGSSTHDKVGPQDIAQPTSDGSQHSSEVPHPTAEKKRGNIELSNDEFLALHKRKLKRYKQDTVWFRSSGAEPLNAPQQLHPQLSLPIGALYIHQIKAHGSTPIVQIWIFREDLHGVATWHSIPHLQEQKHPTLHHLVLSFNPTWVIPDTARRLKDPPKLRYAV
ncbi:hypothetical protein BKA93DRAFT_753053 [Sparassis latifolia]